MECDKHLACFQAWHTRPLRNSYNKIMNDSVMLKYVEPESIEPADCNGLKEDGDEKGEAGRVVLQQVEDVEPALQGGLNGML